MIILIMGGIPIVLLKEETEDKEIGRVFVVVRLLPTNH